jgi:hypothetical protein
MSGAFAWGPWVLPVVVVLIIAAILVRRSRILRRRRGRPVYLWQR